MALGPIKPMLAVKAPQPFDSDRHIFEVKSNGIRAIAFIEQGRLRLQSRGLKDITEQFPELSGLPTQLKGDKIVLDGEIVVLDEQGRPSKRIRERISQTKSMKIEAASALWQARYMVFDLLYENGISLMGKPLIERKVRLQALLENSERARAIQFIEGEGIRLFNAVRAEGLEGVMAKSKSSLYLPGRRSQSWQKFK